MKMRVFPFSAKTLILQNICDKYGVILKFGGDTTCNGTLLGFSPTELTDKYSSQLVATEWEVCYLIGNWKQINRVSIDFLASI